MNFFMKVPQKSIYQEQKTLMSADLSVIFDRDIYPGKIKLYQSKSNAKIWANLTRCRVSMRAEMINFTEEERLDWDASIPMPMYKDSLNQKGYLGSIVEIFCLECTLCVVSELPIEEIKKHKIVAPLNATYIRKIYGQKKLYEVSAYLSFSGKFMPKIGASHE